MFGTWLNQHKNSLKAQFPYINKSSMRMICTILKNIILIESKNDKSTVVIKT